MSTATRLKELSTALHQIHPLVARLRDFTAAIGQGDDARLELGAEIHSRLKEAEEEMELLRIDVEAIEQTTESRRKTVDQDREAERERVVALAGKLTEELKRTRSDFRSAQLQAKKNAEAARRKERDILLSRSHGADVSRRQPSEKLTQEDLMLNASSDVTSALRRTHQLMQAELSRSQFAQETLESSTAALSSLSESYTDLDSLIASSRNLLGSLLRSQKSDTWYLETAFYILVGTIAWLVFRRVLYGPLWWLVWLPFKLVMRVTFALLGTVGITGTALQTSAGTEVRTATILPVDAVSPVETLPPVEAPFHSAEDFSEEIEDRMIDQIAKMAEDSAKEGTNIDDISPEERQRQEELPRNPKKRMFEAEARAAAAAAAAASGGSKPKTATKEDQSQHQPWVEKYRPKTLDDVAAQDHTTKVLQRTLQASNLPHMLFYGPPGTGKTSTILALAKSLFGPALYRTRILELNASDERGIGIVRDKIKNFARTQLSQSTGMDAEYLAQYPCPPFKIIILDEADSMTQDAQAALRRTMEQYSKITRFCLVCNYVTRIIEPLASRCSKFRFKALDNSAAGDRLEHIAKLENLRLGDGVVETLIRCSEGDLRRAITYLQSAARLVGANKAPNTKEGGDEDEEMADAGDADLVTVRMIEEIAGVVPDSVLDRLVQAMQPGKTGSTYEAVSAVVTDIVADGWSATQILGQLYRRVIFNDAIPDLQKNKLVMVFSELDKRLVDGADEHLSILDMALRISGILGGS
ncbi:hypothetical protein ASPZODRAFT_61741 [Penicilliopsis zonata CBS 506.65]|uniref:Replication factor C subunit 2 n=1 Tax=Penicilliopsis zonata CBS 506.65 TaxID=1073090 RepID=A0A1L9SN97_9EURO|nr:hypothetical protein ASPZODRAFT_61741 [Penicilliopsis zonata CBS 506.65]OJJ48583.1 hypothetical protein ASPZODRAFT_61741 [Penicilliopsis zonata CBS 506.65]